MAQLSQVQTNRPATTLAQEARVAAEDGLNLDAGKAEWATERSHSTGS